MHCTSQLRCPRCLEQPRHLPYPPALIVKHPAHRWYDTLSQLRKRKLFTTIAQHLSLGFTCTHGFYTTTAIQQTDTVCSSVSSLKSGCRGPSGHSTLYTLEFAHRISNLFSVPPLALSTAAIEHYCQRQAEIHFSCLDHASIIYALYS